jgi:hypothetical protein
LRIFDVLVEELFFSELKCSIEGCLDAIEIRCAYSTMLCGRSFLDELCGSSIDEVTFAAFGKLFDIEDSIFLEISSLSDGDTIVLIWECFKRDSDATRFFFTNSFRQ